MTTDGDVTRLFQSWCAGDATALPRVRPLLYDELRRMTQDWMCGEHPGRNLAPGVVIQEAYLKLVGEGETDWRCRKLFFGQAACLMRQVLVDFARGKMSGDDRTAGPETDLVSLDLALARLREIDPSKAQAIELRHFAGLTIEEVAGIMEVPAESVCRELRMGEAWLAREMSPRL